MKQKLSLEQKYKNAMTQAAPDLWSRIEENLKEYPERELHLEKEEASEKNPSQTRPTDIQHSYGKIYKRITIGTTAAIAAACLLVITGPWYFSLFPVGNRTEASMETNSDWETGNSVLPAEETKLTSEETSQPAFASSSGVLHYSQLDLASYSALSLTSQAITVAEDTMYFSEDILADTELLCLGTVTSVSLETDQSQNAVFLVYDITLESIFYSEDYTEGLKSLTVKSPIVEAKGSENQILYQLQSKSSYVLPLKRLGNDWQLLFPFAPQVQITGSGAYLFHSGYTSLTNENTFVVVGEQEGTNDFYYDRMLLRDDDDFLSDFLSLVQRCTGYVS